MKAGAGPSVLLENKAGPLWVGKQNNNNNKKEAIVTWNRFKGARQKLNDVYRGLGQFCFAFAFSFRHSKEGFVEDVEANFIMWEIHGRDDYSFNTTMKKVQPPGRGGTEHATRRGIPFQRAA